MATDKAAAQTANTPLANVDANMFRAAFICASREETRYYLNGVFITPHPDKGALLIATDGHRMLVVHDESAWCREACIVQLDIPGLNACKPQKAKDKPDGERSTKRLVIDSDGKAEIEGAWRSPGKVLIDGTFPDWRRIIPFNCAWAGKPAAFNSGLLSSFGDIGSILAFDKKPRAMRVVTDGDSDPAMIRMAGVPHAFGVLMPMRDGSDAQIPAFMKPIEIAIAAERVAAQQEAERARAKAEQDAKPVVPPATRKRKPIAKRTKPKARKATKRAPARKVKTATRRRKAA